MQILRKNLPSGEQIFTLSLLSQLTFREWIWTILILYIPISLQAGHMRCSTGEKAGPSSHSK